MTQIHTKNTDTEFKWWGSSIANKAIYYKSEYSKLALCMRKIMRHTHNNKWLEISPRRKKRDLDKNGASSSPSPHFCCYYYLDRRFVDEGPFLQEGKIKKQTEDMPIRCNQPLMPHFCIAPFVETRRTAGLRPAFCSLLSLTPIAASWAVGQGLVPGVTRSGTRCDKVCYKV